MPLNGKRLADAGLSTSMMVAFAIPGGAPVGAGIAIVQFLFDALMDIFTPPPVPPPPPLTQAELTAALTEIKADIIDAIWKSNADHVTNRILALNKGFGEVWAGMQTVQMDGQRYIVATDRDTRDWIAATKLYFHLDPTDGLLTEVRGYRNDIQNSSLNDGSLTPTQVAEHRTRTTGLYCLISSLAISYLKAAIMFKWGLELLEAWQYQEYQKKVDHWKQQNAAYQAKNPLTALQAQYPGLNLDPGYAPPEWNHWVAHDPQLAVPILIKEVQELLDYCVLVPDPSGGPGQAGLYTLYQSRWDEYLKLIDSFDVAVDPNAGVTKAQMQLALSNAQQRIKDGGALLYKYSFTHMTEPDITMFAKNIDAWRSASADVSFVNYAVVAGDTLIGLAQKTDGDATHVDKLFALNSPPLTDPNLLPLGTVLKTYPKGTLQYATLPPKKGA